MIFVIGTGRSGTTTTARLLQTRLGVDMGGPSRISPAQTAGDWENPFVNDLNWQLVSHVYRGGKNFKGIAGAEPISPCEWTNRIRDWADKKEGLWGVKHPGFTLIMPHLLNAFPEAKFIWCVRDLQKVVSSWVRNVEAADEYHTTINMQYRYWATAFELSRRGMGYLPIDFSERLDEDYIVKLMGEYLGLEEIQ